MLALDDGTLVLAATDLTNHLACAHLTQQRLAIARGERSKPRPTDDPHADLIRRRGDEHEREQLDRLSTECGGHADLSTGSRPRSREQLAAAARATVDAMREGVPLTYQGQFFDGRWPSRTIRARLDTESRHPPRLRDLEALEGLTPHGWRLEEFVCDELLACREGDRFRSIREDRIQALFNRRSGAIAAAIAITIEAPQEASA